jgi:hypothetical protein
VATTSSSPTRSPFPFPTHAPALLPPHVEALVPVTLTFAGTGLIDFNEMAWKETVSSVTEIASENVEVKHWTAFPIMLHNLRHLDSSFHHTHTIFCIFPI